MSEQLNVLLEFYRDNDRMVETVERVNDSYLEMLDALEVLEAENAKLREQIHWLKQGDVLHVLTDQELADQQKHEREMQASITALDAENDKLRRAFNETLIRLVAANDVAASNYMDDEYLELMRELGVEVGE